MVYFRWQPSTLLQNFIHLRQSAAELLLFVQKSKMAAAAMLNYNFVTLDHPRSPFVHLKFVFKFRVNRVRTFRDIAIRIFRKFGLKRLFRPLKIMFLGSFDPQTLFFIIQCAQGFLLPGEIYTPTVRNLLHFFGTSTRLQASPWRVR